MICWLKGTPSRCSSASLSGMPTGRNRDRRARAMAHNWRRRPSPTRALGVIAVEVIAVKSCVSAEERFELVVEHVERGSDRHMHVEVLVGSEPPSEQDPVLTFCQFAVRKQALPVGGSVDGVVGLVMTLGEARELTHDNRLIASIIALGVEVTELVDACVRDFFVRVVHDGCALEISDGEDFLLEIEGAP